MNQLDMHKHPEPGAKGLQDDWMRRGYRWVNSRPAVTSGKKWCYNHATTWLKCCMFCRTSTLASFQRFSINNGCHHWSISAKFCHRWMALIPNARLAVNPEGKYKGGIQNPEFPQAKSEGPLHCQRMHTAMQAECCEVKYTQWSWLNGNCMTEARKRFVNSLHGA